MLEAIIVVMLSLTGGFIALGLCHMIYRPSEWSMNKIVLLFFCALVWIGLVSVYTFPQ